MLFFVSIALVVVVLLGIWAVRSSQKSGGSATGMVPDGSPAMTHHDRSDDINGESLDIGCDAGSGGDGGGGDGGGGGD